MSLLDQLNEAIGERGVSRMADQVGTDKEAIGKALAAAVPTMVGALGKKADSEQGKGELKQWIHEHDDDDAPDDPDEFFKQGHHEKRDPSPMLDGIFGKKRNRIENGIGKAAGLDSRQVGNLMKLLAPLVLSQLAKKGKREKHDDNSMFDIIRGGAKEAETKTKSGGLLARFLDQDGDGDFDFADICQIGLSFFRKKK